MNVADIVIILLVVAAVVAIVRNFMSGKSDKCAGCGSASTCTRSTTGECKPVEDMLAHAEEALGKQE